MGQSCPQMIAGAIEENLRLIFQPTKRAGVNDPGAIALELGPVGMTRLRIFSSAGIAGFLPERREDASLVGFHFFARFPIPTRDNAVVRIICHDPIIRRRGCFASRNLALANIACLAFSASRATLRQSNESTRETESDRTTGGDKPEESFE
jgi:hypothetical protein